MEKQEIKDCILKELIILQYQKGSLLDLSLYKNKDISSRELLGYLEELRLEKIITYINPNSTQEKFFVIPPSEIVEGIYFPYITIRMKSLSTYKYIPFLEIAYTYLNSMVKLNLEPLGIETPQHPHNYSDLIQEKSRIERVLENIKEAIDTSKFDIDISLDKNLDLKKYNIYYTKSDGTKIHFQIPICTFLPKDAEKNFWDEIGEIIKHLIDDFLQDNQYHLPQTRYTTKVISFSDNPKSNDEVYFRKLNDFASINLEDIFIESEL